MKLNKNSCVYLQVLKDGKQHGLRNTTTLWELIDIKIQYSPVGKISFPKLLPSANKYIKNELEWYLSMDTNIKGHKGIENNKIWQSCASPEGNINSNYGYLMFHPANGCQYKNCLIALLNDRETRQALMIYTRPSIHQESKDMYHAKHDMICTAYVQCFIRENRLTYHIYQRSCDIIFGMRNDLAWHQYVYNKLWKELKLTKYKKLKRGDIFYTCGSLHLYKSYYEQNEELINILTSKRS
jgi:thymidylate synthase